MAKYIDKDALVAELEKRIEETKGMQPKFDQFWAGQISAFKGVLKILDTLEVEEVDLDREIYDYFNAWQNVLCDEDCCNEGGFCCVLDENVKPVNIARCRKIAKHFYELGLKAKLQSVFPELRETKDKDKRIGEEIIQYIKDLHKFGYLLSKFSEEWIAWLEKQKPLPEGCVRKQVAEAKEALYTAEVETGDGGIKAVVTKEVSIKSEDGAIRKELINTINLAYDCGIAITKENRDKYLAWIEKQGEQKSIWHNEDEEPQRGSLILLIMQSGTAIVAKIIEPNHTFNHGERWAYIDDLLEKQGEHSIFDVPSREVILAIWQLGNDWKELTDGVICTEYGTQLDYIQKHWQESEYYLRSKQGK